MERTPTSTSATAEQSSLLLKVLLETIPDLVWLKDPDGVYLECNLRFQTFFGKTRAEFIGHTDFELFDHEAAAFFRSKDLAALHAGHPSMNEETIFDQTKGKNVILETIKTPMKASDGKILGVLGIARDISERKAYEALMQRRLEAVTAPGESADGVELEDVIDLKALQALQDNFSGAFNVASLVTRLDGTPLTKPSNFCQFCNLVRTTELGRQNCRKSDAELGRYNPDGPNVKPCLSGGLWDSGVPIVVGKRQVAKWLIGQVRDDTQNESQILAYADRIGVDREELLKAFYRVPVMSEEQFKNIAGVLNTFAAQIATTAYQNLLQARYISERKQSEDSILRINAELKATSEALEQSNRELAVAARRAEESDRLKSAFLANMSHEIRTPLNAIIGFSSLLGDPSFTREETGEFVSLINKSGENLLELINNIIDISKLDAGLAVHNPKPTRILALLSDVYDIFHGELLTQNNGDVSLRLSLPPAELEGLCDQTRLRQVLNNLLQNALKFTSRGIIELGCREDENEPGKLLLWVKDTGIGIAQENHAAIFERFRQATNETEKLYGGTGLGLAISRSCVELMGGHIWLESDLGQGTTFFFTLPFQVHSVEERSVPQPDADNFAFSGQHILIAEDDPVNFQYLKTVLRVHDLRISQTTTGRDTVAKVLGDESIDLVLMDIRMPDGNGLEATREIRKTNPRIPIIAQTGYAFSSDLEQCLAAGCNDYIPKPMKKNDLLKTLQQHLNASTALE
ncbi:MAG: PocR ligand-binding domain-containing protein [Opitutales bacterium]|nr:PocR ligand-binding domain-containing protein [Opitutales bacterium]